MRLAGLTLCALALSACSGASIDEAFGRPGATEWSYFEQPASDVVQALEGYYVLRDVVVESIREENGGVVLMLANQRGGASVGQILVQSVREGRYQSRAQNYLRRRPLTINEEAAVTGGY